MRTQQNDTLLLQSDPIAQTLLQSTHPAQLAYTWMDGTPRVVPIWFHWNGRTIVLGSPPTAPKVKALSANPKVALTINSDGWPYKVLLVRGTTTVEMVDGVPEEYALCATRYFGAEQGKAWVGQVGGLFAQMVRFEITPDWVNIMDFETRFPVAIATAMAATG